MLGGATAVLGLASAGIIQFTKDKPKARKVAFVGLAGLTGLFVYGLFMAMKKMS
jgi:FtsH-binding integral membrane protein